tara:strand:+ start:228 stop:611 length:384 start_codon:yes stop_codon:yes gene_type:complete
MNEERKTTLVDEYNDLTHQWYEAHGVRLKKLKRESLINNLCVWGFILVCGYIVFIEDMASFTSQMQYFSMLGAIFIFLLIWSSLRTGQKEILLEIESARQQDDLKVWFFAHGGAEDYQKVIKVKEYK